MRPGAAGPSDPARGGQGAGAPVTEVLRGVPMHRLLGAQWRKMKESGGGLIIVRCEVVGCYPTENPLASGGRAGRSPRGGSGAFTHSCGLPRLSTRGLHYTILRFFVDTTTLLNTYTSHRANRSQPQLAKVWGDGAPHWHGFVARGASPSFTESPNFLVGGRQGGMAPPIDTGSWLGGPPLASRSHQVSPSAEDKGGGRRPPLTRPRD